MHVKKIQPLILVVEPSQWKSKGLPDRVKYGETPCARDHYYGSREDLSGTLKFLGDGTLVSKSFNGGGSGP